TSYDVYFGTANPPLLFTNTAGTSTGVGSLLGGTVYNWYVVAKANSVASDKSNTFSFTTVSSVPKLDLVFRNTQTGDVSVWLMNGLTIKQAAVVYPGLSALWQISGVGDFDADSKADLVFRNTQTGDVAFWLMNGLTIKQAAVVFPA